MVSIEQTFAERLKSERMAQGLEQKRLAEEAGITQGVISHIEKGMTVGHFHTAVALAKVLGVSLDWLVGLTDNKEVRK
jgi:transcriptional regulator with XRE-family HTH domain